MRCPQCSSTFTILKDGTTKSLSTRAFVAPADSSGQSSPREPNRKGGTIKIGAHRSKDMARTTSQGAPYNDTEDTSGVDLPAPKKTEAFGQIDLPAPKKTEAFGQVDLPAPKKDAPSGEIDLPALKKTEAFGQVDLPAPKKDEPFGEVDLPALIQFEQKVAAPCAESPVARLAFGNVS